jgi:hypothetical protein
MWTCHVAKFGEEPAFAAREAHGEAVVHARCHAWLSSPADEYVAPRLDVPIPQDLARAHASPRSPAEAAQLQEERQIQPEDHVEAAAHKVAELAPTRLINDPAITSADLRLDART